MALPRLLVLVLAGGAGGRLQLLTDHLANGRPWDLDRTTGGLMTLPPFQGSERGGWNTGTANSLWRQAELIRGFGADALVVVSADAVYELDYREVAEAHLQSGAEVTMVTTEVAADDAARYGIVEVDGDRVTGYAYKPDEPATTTATNEVFVFDPGPTLDRLRQLAAEVRGA